MSVGHLVLHIEFGYHWLVISPRNSVRLGCAINGREFQLCPAVFIGDDWRIV